VTTSIDADTPEVIACLPWSREAVVLAIDDPDRPLGAAWWHLHEPSMLLADDGSPIPELTMAAVSGARGRGVGGALIDVLAQDCRPS
jgi:GNAT superfamily N-acetyltransferase